MNSFFHKEPVVFRNAGFILLLAVLLCGWSMNVPAQDAAPSAAGAPNVADKSTPAISVSTGDIALAVEPQGLRAQSKRLKDYNLPGLETRVTFDSLQPIEVIQVIEFLALKGGLNNLVIGKGVAGLTTKLKFTDIPVGDALEVVLSMNGLAYEVSGGIITIMTDDEYRKLYGKSFYDHKQVKVVSLKYADATRVAGMLAPVKSEIGTIVPDPVTASLVLIDTPEKIAEMVAVIKTADLATVSRVLPTETRSFVLQYANPEDIQGEITAVLTKEVGSMRMDKRTKTLIVTDLPHNLPRVQDLIQAFDRRSKEVFIEAKIVQVSLSDSFQLGIDWNHLFDSVNPRSQIKTTVKPTLSDVSGGFTKPGDGVGSLTYRTILAGGDLTVILDALKSIGDTRILSNPHVAVVDGNEATIKVVRNQPYAESQLEAGTTNVVGTTLKFIEVGVSLSVKPRIGDDGFISMSIKPEVSTVEGTYQAQYSVPIVQKSLAETVVMIKDGETVIIAGMIENTKGTRENSVPFLGSIPLVGLLFKSQSDLAENKETIVFLTPRIISGDEPVQLMRDVKKPPKPLRAVGGVGNKQLKPIR